MDHEQSIEELKQEIDRLKELLRVKENELNSLIANSKNQTTKNKGKEILKIRTKRKARVSSQKGRLFGLPKNTLETIKSKFSTTARKLEKTDFRIDDSATHQNYNYDASIDEVIENFSNGLKIQQERLAELNLKPNKKQKASRVSARVTFSPKLLMNKVKKNFNAAKIVVMRRVSSASYLYNEYMENKTYKRDQELAEDLQAEEDYERIKERKADFKAALKDAKHGKKLNLKEGSKVVISRTTSMVIAVPSVLLNSIKKNFNKIIESIKNKENKPLTEDNDNLENKSSKNNQETSKKTPAKEKKVTIKSEKKEERERRHQAILDMIKALDQEQQQVLKAQKEELSSLQSEIMYNIRETSGRRR